MNEICRGINNNFQSNHVAEGSAATTITSLSGCGKKRTPATTNEQNATHMLNLSSSELGGLKKTDSLRAGVKRFHIFNSRSKRLMKAVKRGNLIKVIKHIRKGANVNYRDEKGYTPVMYAVSASYSERQLVLRELIDSGADLNAQSSSGNTPLHYACMAGDFAGNPIAVDMLLNSGAHVNALNEDTMQTPLFIAATFGQLSIVKLLIAAGADVNLRDSRGLRPIDCAIVNNHKGVQQLLERLSN